LGVREQATIVHKRSEASEEVRTQDMMTPSKGTIVDTGNSTATRSKYDNLRLRKNMRVTRCVTLRAGRNEVLPLSLLRQTHPVTARLITAGHSGEDLPGR